MTKIDFKKKLKQLYNPSVKKVEIVDVPLMNFLMIDGSGDPNTAQEYKDAVETLFAVSYALKFMVKKEKGVDYGVLPLEGLWWTDDMNQFSMENKDVWKCTSMIMQPEYVTETLVHEASERVEKKNKPRVLPKVRFESFREGLSAQTMHIGPYSAEGPTIKSLHNFIKENGYELREKHHEIYISDPRRSAPERLKTVIRQPTK
ncbi:MAG: GyrI-like domain-containing protein [Candidatus Bathyarchaeota archaeon]|nr:MAG: GyrI-like domain-containing protein [Candidatus Bathyarchaeota archaeon]